MNEQIYNLAEQASEYAVLNPSDEVLQSETEDAKVEISKAFIDKFSELIVRECIDYMNHRTKDWDAELRWIFNDGSGYMDVDVDSLLKKHFGIEE